MIIEQIAVGPMANFSYLIADREGGEAVVIDPAFETDPITAKAQSLKVSIALIVLTHHHFDHVNAASALKSTTGARIIAHEAATYLLHGSVYVDRTVRDGDLIPCGGEMLKVIHTPGHTPDGICLLVDNKWLLTGDTLFIGNCGRTDLPGGSQEELFESLQKLKRLPDHLIVLPGHDYGRAATAELGAEKRLNAAIAASTRDEFLAVP